MDRQTDRHWTETRALLHRRPGDTLIVRPGREPDEAWTFPGVRVPANASAEETLRRLCQTALGIRLELMIPQPTFELGDGRQVVTYRYYLCPVVGDEVLPLGYAEVRWVRADQLGEYVLDAGAYPIVERLRAGGPR